MPDKDDDKTPEQEEELEVRVEGEEAPAQESDAEEKSDEQGEEKPKEDKKEASEPSDDDDAPPTEEELAQLHARRKREKQERKERRERAIERDKLEMNFLRQRNEDLEKRLLAQEMRSHRQDHYTVEQKIAEAEREARLAEEVMAKAIAEANGDDAARALRIRDEALDRIRELSSAREDLKRQEEVVKTPKNVADPVVNSYAKVWISKNPWYDVNGGDEDSRIVLEIDQRLANEGYVPRTELYWKELDKRVRRNLPHRYDANASRYADEDESDDYDDRSTSRQAKNSRETEDGNANSASRGAKKGPPLGQSREHAPASTRKEVYISKERKDALIQAGVWDDPVLRQRYIKQYQAWDRENATAR